MSTCGTIMFGLLIEQRHVDKVVKRFDEVTGDPVDKTIQELKRFIDGTDIEIDLPRYDDDPEGDFDEKWVHTIDAFEEDGKLFYGKGDLAGDPVLFTLPLATDGEVVHHFRMNNPEHVERLAYYFFQFNFG